MRSQGKESTSSYPHLSSQPRLPANSTALHHHDTRPSPLDTTLLYSKRRSFVLSNYHTHNTLSLLPLILGTEVRFLTPTKTQHHHTII